jgi:2,3-diketo-5-methylthio-1-phosphopentane phosphatase
MNHNGQQDYPQKVLVSDFDGTMTGHDFFKLAINQLLPADVTNHWSEYRAGRITHFQALQKYFAEIRFSEAEVIDVVDQMELDPALPQAVADLRKAGWQVIVTSAGCDWYIRRLLGRAGVELEVHANPGSYVPGRGLRMELPLGSPFLSPTLGVDKARVVRQNLACGRTVAFAGDGFPDEEAARLVPGPLRFARGDLANVLRQHDEPFETFSVWSEIARRLLAGESRSLTRKRVPAEGTNVRNV